MLFILRTQRSLHFINAPLYYQTGSISTCTVWYMEHADDRYDTGDTVNEVKGQL